jgi:hypothetical protein
MMPETNVIHWGGSQVEAAKGANAPPADLSLEQTFLRSRIRSLREARAKLGRVLDPLSPMLARICRVDAALRRHGVATLAATRDETLLYLANAWDCEDTGLFDPRPKANVALALDWSLAATVLPPALAALHQSASLKLELQKLLKGDFPRTQAYLDRLVELEPRDTA